MKKLSYLMGVCFALLLIVNGCYEDPSQSKGADCGGCADPPPGGGTIGPPSGGGFGQPPVINSFSPQKGFAGTRITILGSRFSATPAFNIVSFDGLQAQVVSATTTSLNVIAPANVTTGKISVSVSGLSTTSAADFQVLDIPLGGLAAFYPFDGNANDASVNQNHGVVTGATPATDRNGNAARSFYLDGNDYLNMGNPPSLQFGGEITISIWVNLQTSSGMIFNKKNAGGSTPGYVFDYATNAFRMYGGFRIFPNAPACQNYYSFTLSTQNWTSLTVTISGSQSKYYKDGVLVGTNAGQCPLPVTSEGNFLVGNSVHLGWGYLIGYVDDIAIYNRALSDTEVLALHNQPIIP
jgi:hypothetical protein